MQFYSSQIHLISYLTILFFELKYILCNTRVFHDGAFSFLCVPSIPPVYRVNRGFSFGWRVVVEKFDNVALTERGLHSYT